MKKAIVLFGCLALISRANAQDEGLVKVRAGRPYYTEVSLGDRYRYRDFQPGFIYYPNGKHSAVYKFNYDFLRGTMVVIKSDGDTITVTGATNRYVVLKNEIYFHPKGEHFIELISVAESVKLGFEKKYEVKRYDRVITDVNGTRPDIANRGWSYVRSPSPGPQYWMRNADVYLRKAAVYYVIDKNEKTYRASMTAMFTVFPKKRSFLESYFKKNKVNFRSRLDLENLFESIRNDESNLNHSARQ